MPRLGTSSLYDTVPRTGQDNSRTHDANLDHSTERVVGNATKANVLLGTRHTSGSAVSTTQKLATIMHPTSEEKSPERLPAIRNSLKRSRDERDEDDYQLNRTRNPRTPPRRFQNGERDHYSPPRARRPMSPFNTRHAFVPDREDRYRPRQDTIGGNSGSPLLKSPPPQRRRSSPRRSSPARRSHSGLAECPEPLLNPSPPKYPPQDSDMRGRLQYSNSTWKAPRPISTQKPDSTVDLGSEKGSDRVTFNGLAGVPTGPKHDLPQRLPNVESEGKLQPHIFISSEWVPAQRTTVAHLHNFLKRYVLNPLNILVDDVGYYIIFEDTIDGHKRLEKCYSQRNGQKLFREYPLIMECRQGLGNNCEVYNKLVEDDDMANAETVVAEPPKQVVAGAELLLSQCDVPAVQFGASSEPQNPTNLHLQEPEAHALKTINPVSHADMTIPFQRHSSPFRVPSRQDRDDSSSISGFTGSEVSDSKLSKCHSCKVAPLSDTDLLVQCASCPRRYHSRCHMQPPIPPSMDMDRVWQCRRCVKKQVQPKSRLSNSSLIESNSPASSFGRPEIEEPPAKKPRLEGLEPTLRNSITDNGEIFVVAEEHDPRYTSVHKDSDQSAIKDIEPVPSAKDHFMVEKAHLSNNGVQSLEADTLVAKSFAVPEVEEQRQVGSPKPTKLNLTRKKVIRSEDRVEPNNLSAPSTLDAPETDTALRESEETNEDHIHGDGTSNVKRKSHEWPGGGADKDIIQSGISSISAANNSPRDDASQVNDHNYEVQPSAEPRLKATEHVARSHDDHNTQSEAELPHKPADNTKDEIAASSTSTTNERKGPIPQKGHARRSAPTLSRCSECGRKIAFNPSGNEFCSRCKKNTSANSMLSYTSPSGVPTEQSKHNTTEPSTEQRDSHHSIASGMSPPSHKTMGNHEKPDDARPGSSKTCAVSSETGPKNPGEEFMTGATRSPAPQSQTSPSMEHDNLGGAREAEEDIDLWNTKDNDDPDGSQKLQERDTQDMPSKSPGEREFSSTLPLVDDSPAQSSPSLSPPPTEDTPEPLSKSRAVVKRQRHSRTTVAKSEYDIGDSFTRPANTYERLIGMALCDSPGYSLKSSEIVDWVHDNVPTYNKGEDGGIWENGLRATLSMHRKREVPKKEMQLWKKIALDGAKKNSPCQWQLLPGKADTMPRWDPVLKTPVSPANGWNERQDEEDHESNQQNSSLTNLQRGAQAEEDTRSKDQSTHKMKTRREKQEMKKTKHHAEPVLSDQMDVDIVEEPNVDGLDPESNARTALIQDASESSEDEPIAASRRRRTFNVSTATTKTLEKENSMNSNEEPMDNEISQPRRTADAVSPITPVSTTFVRAKENTTLHASERFTLAQLIKSDANNRDYSAKSLFDEWPEYDPANEFDREAKIAEIKRRPTRKQKFGKPSPDPWLGWKSARSAYKDVRRDSSMSAERTKRSSRNVVVDAYPWEIAEGNAVPVDTLEELFGMPNNPIPINHKGQIAYRDGTRNDDGSLPRAKNIYETGYA